MKRLRLAADQRKIILGYAEERGRFAAGRLLAVKAVTDGDEGRIGIELEFDCATCALSRVLLCHMVGLHFDWQASGADLALSPRGEKVRRTQIDRQQRSTGLIQSRQSDLYWPGVKPTALRKTRLKLACDPNPHSSAISTSEEWCRQASL